MARIPKEDLNKKRKYTPEEYAQIFRDYPELNTRIVDEMPPRAPKSGSGKKTTTKKSK